MNLVTRWACTLVLFLCPVILQLVAGEEYVLGIEDWESTSFPSLSRDQPSYNVLVVSTLNGSLFGVDHTTGDTLWKLDNDPAVRISATSKEGVVPVFFPDPKDGALYILNTAESVALKKLPFSVQQLVASSPCRGSDGIFYSGKKVDDWFSVDVSTGKKTPLFTGQNQIDDGQTCPTEIANSIFIGRTVYSLLMFDGKPHKRAWNITFSDYTSHTLPKEQLNNYAFKHVGSISSGRVKTVDRRTGHIQWERDFGSPMVGIYLRRGHDIINLPFTSTAESMLDSPLTLQNDQLQSTLYIDKYHHGLYALPSLVDTSVPVVAENAYPMRLLIGGPDQVETSFAIIPGHYKISPVKSTQLLIGGRTDIIIQPNRTSFNSTRNPPRVVQKREEMTQTDPSTLTWNLTLESKILAVVVAVLSFFVVTMFLYIMAQVREIKHSSQGSSQGSSSSSSNISQHGFVTVGKISFDTRDILGKGCEGTFVFRGNFDNRRVAVKRLLPECFTVADREVQLLRESDAHPNVIRYFSTEEDSQFRYIALELCSATLQDYVEKGLHRNNIAPVEVLNQAICGLEHLHSLKIVHRDIKPHNILLSTNSPNSQVRVMISDFGLCKKLLNGRASFSKKSGITGTEGWIAPEMMLSNGRVTSSVDIFSMGCVFYFTLVNGKHPFGEPLRRQSNILTEDYKLSSLDNDDLWRILITTMISKDPSERPSAETVRMHPVFWPKSQILAFLQDMSDRVEKVATDSEILLELETGGLTVCEGDWTKLIDPEVAQDLGKYRSYKGDSIRDLLRALRNKRHHYRELCERARELLGHSAESYVSYWLSRFPRLLYHTWSSMQFLKGEPSLAPYYDPTFSFPFVRSDIVPRWILENGTSMATPLLTAKTLNKQSSPKKRYARRPPLSSQPPQSTHVIDSEREAWIKAGAVNGAWRPGRGGGVGGGGGGARERRRARQTDEIKDNDWKVTE